VHVPKEIIRGHGPIFEGEARDLMAALFRVGGASEALKTSVPVTVQSAPQGQIERNEQQIHRSQITGETTVSPPATAPSPPPR
jgi:hypothetical protein